MLIGQQSAYWTHEFKQMVNYRILMMREKGVGGTERIEEIGTRGTAIIIHHGIGAATRILKHRWISMRQFEK
jgi:hypothetical protein